MLYFWNETDKNGTFQVPWLFKEEQKKKIAKIMLMNKVNNTYLSMIIISAATARGGGRGKSQASLLCWYGMYPFSANYCHYWSVYLFIKSPVLSFQVKRDLQLRRETESYNSSHLGKPSKLKKSFEFSSICLDNPLSMQSVGK